MNRKSFFKNLIGATISTVIGSKLDFIPEVKENFSPSPWMSFAEYQYWKKVHIEQEREIWRNGVPRMRGQAFTIKLNKDWFKPEDIITEYKKDC